MFALLTVNTFCVRARTLTPPPPPPQVTAAPVHTRQRSHPLEAELMAVVLLNVSRRQPSHMQIKNKAPHSVHLSLSVQ